MKTPLPVVLTGPDTSTLSGGNNRPGTARRVAVATGLITAALFLLSGCTASTTSSGRLDPGFGQALEAGFSAQVIHPEGPADPAPADTLPGDLAVQIYNKRYVKAMTEEKKEKDDAASQLSGLD